jgi:hypothetical protein
MKKLRNGLLMLLVCAMQLHALDYSNGKLGFTARLPDGLQDLSGSVMRRGSLVTLGKTRADKKGFERMVMLQDLGGLIGREMPKPSEMPANARVETVPWKSHEVLLVAVREVEAGVASVTLNAQVPLTPKAIQVSVFGPQSDEAQLRQELRAIVASVEGPTNWGETGMAMTQERITRLSHGIGRFWLWGCLLVIAGSAAFKTLFRREFQEADSPSSG